MIEYNVNMIGILVLVAGPPIFSSVLGMFKFDKTLFLKRCYLFSCRQRAQSEVYVFFSLLKDSLFAVSAILFNVEFTLGLMLVYMLV